MRYDMTNFFEDPGGACRVLKGGRGQSLSIYETDPPAQGKFCSSATGTGVNAKSNPHNKAGDATKGVCYSQVRLK